MGTAYLVTDLGFGDAGKGSLVSALIDRFGADLVCRASGGSNCGHTVQVNGKKHIFKSFGSGTLQGVSTHLGPKCLVNPVSIIHEKDALTKLGVRDPLSMMTVDPGAPVITPYHVYLNRSKELHRGSNRHGSCGHGVGETQEYLYQYRDEALRWEDLECKDTISTKLHLLRSRLLNQMYGIHSKNLGNEVTQDRIQKYYNLFVLPREFEQVVESYYSVYKKINTCGRGKILGSLRRGNVIFEGNQGVLLDEKYGLAPYHTWTDCTHKNARSVIYSNTHLVEYNVQSWGVIRSYQTRHGAGPFPSEDPHFKTIFNDPNNPTNDWQGEIRFGHFDIPLTKYAVQCCESLEDPLRTCGVLPRFDFLAINHVDQLPKTGTIPVLTGWENKGVEVEIPLDLSTTWPEFFRGHQPLKSDVPVESIPSFISNKLGIPIGMLGYGPSTEDKVFITV